MGNFQKIHVNGVNYLIVDSIQNLRAEDSFIHRNNKLAVFGGNGEARKYVGSYVGDNGKRLSDFFEFHQWGESQTINNRRTTYPTIQEKCFFSKTNLLKYLYDARIEYIKQEQNYHNNITNYYDNYLATISNLKDEINLFSIYDVSDLINNKNGYKRGYIRSDNEIWHIWRKIVLPKISYLSILKLLPEKMQGKNIQPTFYFRIFLDYQFRSIVHPQLAASTLELTDTVIELRQKSLRSIGRKGQSEYRRKVIDHMPQCPFTLITDEALLKASHIKPYSVCIKEGNESEALDHLNGLSFTPTYDWLFDQGYITFTNDGRLICGAQLSPYTWEKLHINPNAKNKLRIYPEGREKYLDYHRDFVFQDNINDFL